MDEAELTTFQVEVAHTLLPAECVGGLRRGGGAPLAASDLTRRPTQDLDLFTSGPVVSVTRPRSRSSSAQPPALDRHCDPRQPDVLSSRRD
jgi:hypothetical protein